MSGRIKVYSIIVLFLVAGVFTLQVNWFYKSSALEEDQLRNQVNTAMCSSLNTLCKANNPKIMINSCSKLGNGNYQVIAKGYQGEIQSILQEQLKNSKDIDFPFKVDITPAFESPGQKLTKDRLNAVTNQSALIRLKIPSVFQLFIGKMKTEMAVMVILLSSILVMFFFTVTSLKSEGLKDTTDSSHFYRIGQFTFDINNHLLTIDLQKHRITRKECQVLQYLCRSKNQVIRRDELLTDLWGENNYFTGRSLDVYITRLRKHLSKDPHISIESVHGVGFVLNDD